jgi:type II secretion system (T2SS) protein G
VKIRTSWPTRVTFYLFLTFVAAHEVRAELKPDQVRKLVACMAGFELPGKAVKVKSVAETGPAAAEAVVEIETAYRLEQIESGRWRVSEIRVGPGVWEQVAFIEWALGVELPGGNCDDPELFRRASNSSDPSPRRARCLLASLVGVELPSDVVRIKRVSTLSLPLASRPSSMVVAWLEVGVRLVRDSGSTWRVSEIRPGNRRWTNLQELLGALNQAKNKQARADLETLSVALEKFRGERGFYVSADKASVLIDYLSPRYLQRVIRVDPWHTPYHYEGTRERFTLRSAGPDGKDDTPDDIVLSGSTASSLIR